MKIEWNPIATNIDLAMIAGVPIRRCKRGSKHVFIYSEREYPTVTAAWVAVLADKQSKGAA